MHDMCVSVFYGRPVRAEYPHRSGHLSKILTRFILTVLFLLESAFVLAFVLLMPICFAIFGRTQSAYVTAPVRSHAMGGAVAAVIAPVPRVAWLPVILFIILVASKLVSVSVLAVRVAVGSPWVIVIVVITVISPFV